MPVKKLREFLDGHQVKYVIISHSPAYTAQEVAQSAHVPGKDLAKTVMVWIDGKMAMVVLPASDHVHLDRLAQSLGAAKIRLATEGEFKGHFPDCEVGAMPPFGNLYGMEVYVSPRLAEDEDIAFNAGSHTELVKLAYKDFERLVRPRVLEL